MRRIVINTSYERFCVSHKAFLRLRELGQQDALSEIDPGAYWPKAATLRETELESVRRIDSAGRREARSCGGRIEWGGQWTLCPIKSRFYSRRSEMEHRQDGWCGACERGAQEYGCEAATPMSHAQVAG